MTPESNTGNSWDRVAAELRACREAQRRAWGDIDNTTLGRFLAGEVTAEEQQQIENALDTLPELRKLTDLVREVLAEPETAVPSPAPVLYDPAIVPFPQPQSQARTIIPSGEWKTAGPSHQRKRWFRDPRFQQRAGLASRCRERKRPRLRKPANRWPCLGRWRNAACRSERTEST
jgi:hypothetical protein